MIFVNYFLTVTCSVLGTFLLIGLGGFKLVQFQKRAWLRQSVQLLSGGLVGLSSLLLFLFVGCGVFGVTHSDPIFSPDHQSAARVTDHDEGATGGGTLVSVYTHHGFKNGTVLNAGWKAVEARNVHWIGNKELHIEYPSSSGYGPLDCKNFADIQVTCIAALMPSR